MVYGNLGREFREFVMGRGRGIYFVFFIFREGSEVFFKEYLGLGLFSNDVSSKDFIGVFRYRVLELDLGLVLVLLVV